MMSPREAQLAAIAHEVPDRIPVDAICVENVPALAAHLGIEPAAVLDHLGIGGRVVAAPYRGAARVLPDGQALSEWGAAAGADYIATRYRPLAGAATVADIEAHAWPDPDQYDYAAAADAARALQGRYAVRGPYWVPLVCRVFELCGIEPPLVWLAAEPILFEAALRRVFDFTRTYAIRLLDACGDALDIFCLGDDFATQRGLMLSPEHWRRYLKPLYAELFALAKARGKRVWFHSCGDVTAVLPDLVDIGADVWETVQLHTLPMSPAQLKREYGRHLTFFGGINTQRLPFATPEEVRAEVRRVIAALGEGGGYLCGPDHHIKPDVSPENTLALFDEAARFRRAGYTG